MGIYKIDFIIDNIKQIGCTFDHSVNNSGIILKDTLKKCGNVCLMYSFNAYDEVFFISAGHF